MSLPVGIDSLNLILEIKVENVQNPFSDVTKTSNFQLGNQSSKSLQDPFSVEGLFLSGRGDQQKVERGERGGGDGGRDRGEGRGPQGT